MEEKSKLRKLNPRKLAPPPQDARRFMEHDKGRVSRNKIVRFISTFFGEGF